MYCTKVRNPVEYILVDVQTENSSIELEKKKVKTGCIELGETYKEWWLSLE